MRKIVIGFSYSKTMISKIIRKAEGTEFSHVFVVLPPDGEVDNNDYVYQESFPSCNKTTLKDFLYNSHQNVVTEYHFIPVTEEQFAVIKAYADECVAKKVPYGSIQLVGMGIVALLKKIGIKAKNPFSDGSSSMVCSEFAGRILSLAGITISKSELDNEGPALIHRIAQQNSVCVDI